MAKYAIFKCNNCNIKQMNPLSNFVPCFAGMKLLCVDVRKGFIIYLVLLDYMTRHVLGMCDVIKVIRMLYYVE